MLTGTLILVGCKNIPPVTSGTGTENIVPGDDFSKHLKVDNPELSEKLYIADVKSRTTNELLEVNVELSSKYKKSLHLQYHINWFDADGFVIESRKSPWKPIELQGFQSTTVRGLAPTPDVASFNVYVREVPEKYFKF